VILPDVQLAVMAHHHSKEMGLDSPKGCVDPEHFKRYPWPVEYQYNSRGFRDAEWPESLEELKSAIWCLGDSFTVGLGSPVAHTWPAVLSQVTGRRVINVSMDGASNDWICRKVRAIADQVAPQDIVIMWSYLNRVEHPDQHLNERERRLHYDSVEPRDHLENFKRCVDRIEHVPVHWCFVPDPFHVDLGDAAEIYRAVADSTWPTAPRTWQEFAQLPDRIQQELRENSAWTQYELAMEFEYQARRLGALVVDRVPRLDLARDGWHFDVKTAQWLALVIQDAIAVAPDS
jgi:lysophospholipase L1-like esterase